MFAGWPVAQAATRFRQAYPRITLTLEIGTHERLIEDLDAGALDVLISRFSSTVNPQVYRSATLLEDAVVLACGPTHPLAGRPDADLAECVAYPWITALPGSRIRGELEMLLHQAGLPIPDMIGALSLEFGREMLLEGHYLWMLPGSVAVVREARGEVVVPVSYTHLRAHETDS